MSKKEKKQTKKLEDPMLARSPEGFPKLTIFPEGWDLEQTSVKTFRTQSQKKRREQFSFPNTTDAIL